MFIKLSYSDDDRKLFCEPASTCQLAASGFCEERKSALIKHRRTGLLDDVLRNCPCMRMCVRFALEPLNFLSLHIPRAAQQLKLLPRKDTTLHS